MGLVSSHPVKPRSPQTEKILERLRALCLALPDVTEKIAWGEPTWRVRERLFAQFDNHHHGAPHVSVWLATEPEAQAALLDAEPERFFRPAYVGHLGWVAAVLDGDCQWDMVAAVIEQAYHRIAAKAPAKRRAASAAKRSPAKAARAASARGKRSAATGKASGKAVSKVRPPRAVASKAASRAQPKRSAAANPSSGKPAAGAARSRPKAKPGRPRAARA